MKTNKQHEIAVPKSGFKRSSLPWTHDVNTTFGFGEVQPTMSQLLMAGSKTTFKPQSLTRLAPMVAPTFGRVKYKTYSQFVSVSSIFPNYESMMSREPVTTAKTTKVPQSLPYVKLGALSSWCFHGARATLYFVDPDAPDPENEQALGHYRTQHRKRKLDGTWDYTNCSDITAVIAAMSDANIFGSSSDPYLHSSNSVLPDVGTRLLLYPQHVSADMSLAHILTGYIPLGLTSAYDLIPVQRGYTPSISNGFNAIEDYQKEVTWKSADYVLEGKCSDGDDGYYYYAILFEFSDFGKRIRKILQGCGYQIDLCSSVQKRIDPILAQFKAYFDVFGLTLYQGWETTYCYKLIRFIQNDFIDDCNDYAELDPSVLASDSVYSAFSFMMILEIGNEWFTDDTDYISAHMEKLAVSPKADMAEFISVGSTGDIKYSANISQPAGNNSDGTSTGMGAYQDDTILNRTHEEVHGFINQVQHGQVDATLLERLYYWTNKHSIIGRSIRKLMDVFGLGKFIDPTHSQYIGNSDDMITISDVVALASTAEASLGEYGGRGLSFAEGRTIVLENERVGYWITLACIVPEAGYTQGIVPWLNAIKPMEQFQPDFDAVGMEATTKEALVGCSYLTTLTDNSGASQTFGFIPRGSMHKVMFNLVNGDFNRHGLRDVYLPYTLDKQLNVNDFDVPVEVHDTQNGEEFTAVTVRRSPRVSSAPVAGNWARIPTKYAWLGNFTRIFRDMGEHSDSVANISLTQLVGFDDYNNDNFMVHSVLQCTCYAPCKPIEASYGLDEIDPNSVGVEYTSKA